MAADTIVVSACDDNHYPLAADLIASLNEVRDGSVAVGFVNVDDSERCRQFEKSVDLYRTLGLNTDRKFKGFKIAFMKLKSRRPSIFPGFSRHVWIDDDASVQNAKGIANAARGALHADITIHSQLDPHYYRTKIPGDWIIGAYRSIFPDVKGDIARYPMINCSM